LIADPKVARCVFIAAIAVSSFAMAAFAWSTAVILVAIIPADVPLVT
jgi:hypothetical protein